MKHSSLWRWLIGIVVIIIVIGGVIIIIVVRPIPPEPVCPACIVKSILPWGIAEVVLGLVSLGLINKIKNSGRSN